MTGETRALVIAGSGIAGLSATVYAARAELGASEIMADRAREHEDVEFAWNAELVAVDVGGVFHAIGHDPSTDFLRDASVALDEDGYVQIAPTGDEWATTETTASGVFAAGAVIDPDYQRAVTAAGTGSMAALDAEAWLEPEAVTAPARSEPVPTEVSD